MTYLNNMKKKKDSLSNQLINLEMFVLHRNKDKYKTILVLLTDSTVTAHYILRRFGHMLVSYVQAYHLNWGMLYLNMVKVNYGQKI